MKRIQYLLFSTILVAFSCTPPPAPEEIDCSTCEKSVTGYEIVVVESVFDGSSPKQVIANCPGDKKVLSAGWSVLDGTDAILSGRATYSEPSFDGKNWMVNAINMDTGFAPDWKLRVRCICADVED